MSSSPTLSRPTAAFESARLTYSDAPVDLYNSGVNQLLSVAAACGYALYHFCMADLYREVRQPWVRATALELDPDWSGEAPQAWQHVRPIGKLNMALDSVEVCFVRGDDIRREDTPNLDILREADAIGNVVESVDATLSTCDKFQVVERCPGVPQPITYATSDLASTLAAVARLPDHDGWMVIKDRYGFGCGAQVHRLHVDAPGLENTLHEYLLAYGDLLVQEFRPEVSAGDLVVTFFEDELLGAMRRIPAEGEWKSNASLGATQVAHDLSPEQAEIAWTVRRAFSECRLASVDLLVSGRVLEINAFPGGEGLLKAHGVVLAEKVLDRLENGRSGQAASPATRLHRGPVLDLDRRVDRMYRRDGVDAEPVDVVDVFAHEAHQVSSRDLIEVRPAPGSFALDDTPAVVSVPHAGVLVPQRFADRFPSDDATLVEIDLLSHLLYEQLSATQVVSRLTPYFLDMNRGRSGAEGAHVPRHLRNPPHEYYTVDDEPILLRSYDEDEVDDVLRYYDLYHDLVDLLVDAARRRHGWALLIDGHSMTSVGLGRVHDEGEPRDNVVVGTLGGTSADEAIIDAFLSALQAGFAPLDLGITVAENVPYSGGFITRKHHDPADGVHAIQVEVTMDTYMYEADTDPVRRYSLKQQRLDMVRSVLGDATREAVAAGERTVGRGNASS